MEMFVGSTVPDRLTTKVDNLYQTNDKFTPLLGIKRLGEYEDTGLTPEEINGFKHLEVILHTAIDKLTENVKSEAIKEFAEKLKVRMQLEDDCNFDCNICMYECKEYVPLIDDLVKEMTE